jgi:hypothetical protein
MRTTRVIAFFILFGCLINQLFAQDYQLETFGTRNAKLRWGIEAKQNSMNDEDLNKLNSDKIQGTILYNRKNKQGDIYWIGGTLYFDINGSIFNTENASQPNQKEAPRFLEIIDKPGEKLIRVLRISSQRGKYGFYVIKAWVEKKGSDH